MLSYNHAAIGLAKASPFGSLLFPRPPGGRIQLPQHRCRRQIPILSVQAVNGIEDHSLSSPLPLPALSCSSQRALSHFFHHPTKMLGSVVNGRRLMEESLIVAGLIFVQASSAIYTVFISAFLARGLEPLFLVSAGSFTAAFLLSPFAFFLEKKKWPEKIGKHLMVRFALISFGGLPLYQLFMLLGVKKTTPAVATAMPNLAPGLIFIIASCLRIEKFNIKCKYTRFKIMGALMCLIGAMALSFLQAPSEQQRQSSILTSIVGDILSVKTISNEWIMGCIYLFASVMALSSIMVLQASTMDEFPAPISLCVIASLAGSIFIGMFQYILQGNISSGASSIGVTGVIYAVLAGGLMTCISTAIVTMCVHRKGPVFVSVFQPTQTVFAAILSAVILKQFISLGSLLGMAVLFTGLYIVLFAKVKEAGNEEKLLVSDEKEPLLC